MANTLELGNGKWATGKDTVLAFNDENNNFKPLPFSFSRASSGTIVNKDGLIETVGVGEPRIDFKDNTKGALLLEPERTNKVIYEDFTQWTNYNASAVLSEETIYGKNAYKIVEDSTLNNHGLYLTNLFTADGTNYIWSVYVKGGERRYVVLTGRATISSNDSAVIFDTQDGVWTLDASSQNQAFSAESVGNGWWRIAIEGNPTSGAYDSYTIAASLDGTTYTDANYQGDGTSGIYVAMAQIEAGSYATSYIPTSGSAVTRVADVSSQTVPDGVIGQTEGTMFIDIDIDNNSSDFVNFFLWNGSTSNRVFIQRRGNNKFIQCQMSKTGETTVDFSGNTIIGIGRHKMAVSYSNSRLVAYVDGNKIGEQNTGFSYTNQLTKIGLTENSALRILKEIKLYDNSMTDQELIALTTI
jgi:hypothetical protein